jgi:hypothetical protein
MSDIKLYKTLHTLALILLYPSEQNSESNKTFRTEETVWWFSCYLYTCWCWVYALEWSIPWLYAMHNSVIKVCGREGEGEEEMSTVWEHKDISADSCAILTYF